MTLLCLNTKIWLQPWGISGIRIRALSCTQQGKALMLGMQCTCPIAERTWMTLNRPALTKGQLQTFLVLNYLRRKFREVGVNLAEWNNQSEAVLKMGRTMIWWTNLMRWVISPKNKPSRGWFWPRIWVSSIRDMIRHLCRNACENTNILIL